MSILANEEMHAALMKELCTGRKLMESLQSQREREAAAEAAEARKHGQNGSKWKLLNVIPQHEFFIVGQKYGMECWGDREFVRGFQKHNPEMAAAKA